jgi:hypothetical protein
MPKVWWQEEEFNRTDGKKHLGDEPRK